MGCGIGYMKIKRLPLYPTPYRKEPLAEREVELLFSDDVVIEEKIDGKQGCVDCGDYAIFYEFMRFRHEILYTKLPSYYIAFDVYDKTTKRFLGVPEKHEVLRQCTCPHPRGECWCFTPVIFMGRINVCSWRDELLKLMRRPSYYGAPLIEGVVVKNYKKQLFGKAINREFDEAIRGKPHYGENKESLEENKLYQGEEWSMLCYPPTTKSTSARGSSTSSHL